MSESYETFIDIWSQEYWKLPEPLRSDLEIFFEPEKCLLHKKIFTNKFTYDTMAMARRFDPKSGKGMVLICYQSNPPHLRYDRAHIRRIFVHEAEHCFNPDELHSEHEYPDDVVKMHKRKKHENFVHKPA